MHTTSVVCVPSCFSVLAYQYFSMTMRINSGQVFVVLLFCVPFPFPSSYHCVVRVYRPRRLVRAFRVRNKRCGVNGNGPRPSGANGIDPLLYGANGKGPPRYGANGNGLPPRNRAKGNGSSRCGTSRYEVWTMRAVEYELPYRCRMCYAVEVRDLPLNCSADVNPSSSQVLIVVMNWQIMVSTSRKSSKLTRKPCHRKQTRQRALGYRRRPALTRMCVRLPFSRGNTEVGSVTISNPFHHKLLDHVRPGLHELLMYIPLFASLSTFARGSSTSHTSCTCQHSLPDHPR